MPSKPVLSVAPNATDDVRARFAEDLGLMLERANGFPRMAGRILATLMLAEEPQLSAVEIADRLHASSGSVSTMTRLLEGHGVIERFTEPGVRRDWFRLAADPWLANLTRAVSQATRYVEILDRTIETIADTGLPGEQHLTAMRDYYDLLATELPVIVKKAREKRKIQP